ncbi:cuticle protein 8-like [Anopheles bellator]|uniref:cuticle protein 8-like n=1 Tax=Anopheles bellator TaxID=139047 RepID=UPI002648B90C|nr:cuticle protein 8-like [Anopheles bellator]
MKDQLFLVALVTLSAGLCSAKDAKVKVLRQSVSYDTKILHKIPEKTIVEEKKELDHKAPEVEAIVKQPVGDLLLPSYEFGYGVKDPVSGDHKDQWETRLGDHVKGGYRFDEPDGTQRVVEYEADGKRGFEATVKNVDRKEAAQVDELKVDKVAHSYSYLKRT